ncbi:MAG: cob(I)yrinic acid a,c-diamide adenosyltransferase [Dehalococcoidia bacterium]|nr:cob(I)yrinic acid a,c-diamide adenosyltransferase [Dehalococcoidia bacterium]
MSDGVRLSKGLVQVYTGDGKGKTTAALGLALRATGQGFKVIFIQFMKGDPNCGEHRFVEKYHPFELVQLFRSDVFTTPKEQLRREAVETMAYAEKAIVGGKYDVVVLDEVLVAVREGLLGVSDLLDLIKKRPENVELVLTGRNAPPEVVKVADLVTEMLMIKHPFTGGVPARRGIEF